MRSIIAILVAIFAFGTVVPSASAGDRWHYGRNGHLTHNAQHPSYWAPRQQYNSMGDQFAAGVFGFIAGVGTVLVIDELQRSREHRYSPPSNSQECRGQGGVWVKDPRTNERFCAWR